MSDQVMAEALKQRAIESVRGNGFVFKRAPLKDATRRFEDMPEDEKWEHLAFWLYTDVMEAADTIEALQAESQQKYEAGYNQGEFDARQEFKNGAEMATSVALKRIAALEGVLRMTWPLFHKTLKHVQYWHNAQNLTVFQFVRP